MNPNIAFSPTLDGLIVLGTNVIVPVMITGFVLALFARLLVYFTVARQDWFTKEFEKRVARYLQAESLQRELSFFTVAKKMLEKTFYEIFEARAVLNRRKTDSIMSLTDRIFLIKQGSAWLVRDILKQIKYFNHEKHDPKLFEISKNTFQKNPCFTRVFGLFSASGINEVLSILPGLFIIAGILGTFLGIMKALPELSDMNPADPDQTKIVMDAFLVKMSFAMSKSAIGILFSVFLSVFNTIFSPDKVYGEAIDRFHATLEIIWNRADNNKIPSAIPEFDENRDPLEALAEQSLNQQLKGQYAEDVPGVMTKNAS